MLNQVEPLRKELNELEKAAETNKKKSENLKMLINQVILLVMLKNSFASYFNLLILKYIQSLNIKSQNIKPSMLSL